MYLLHYIDGPTNVLQTDHHIAQCIHHTAADVLAITLSVAKQHRQYRCLNSFLARCSDKVNIHFEIVYLVNSDGRQLSFYTLEG